MKLMRVRRPDGAVFPCVLQGETVRDISKVAKDINPQTIGKGLLETLTQMDFSTLPEVDVSGLELDAPMARPANIWCIGLNYSDHAKEAGMPIPAEPILFNKAAATFCGPDDPILYSPEMTKLDWEVELGIVIGKPTLRVSKEQALDHVLGYVVVNDVSERAWQLEHEGQWVKGKSYPNFCPVGPHLVTHDDVEDVHNLSLWLDVNGERMQSGSTKTMIFDVPTIVSYMSTFTRLEPGDLICTGTPPGVGAGMNPQKWLKTGDRIELGIEGLGRQAQTVIVHDKA